MLDIQSRRVVVSNRTTIGKAAVAVLTLRAGCDVGWSTVAAVTTMRRVLIEGCGVNDQTAAVRQDCTSASGASVERFMSAKAVWAEGVPATATSGAI